MSCLRNSPEVEQRMAAELRRPVGGNGRNMGPSGPAGPPKRRVLPPVSWYAYLAGWIVYRVIGDPIYDKTGKLCDRQGKPWRWHRLRGLAKWLILSAARVPMFLRTVFSQRVDPATFAKCQTRCWECPFIELQLYYDRRNGLYLYHTYCGSCGCPRWILARLDTFKNWRQGHECPQDEHPGSPSWRKVKEILEKRHDDTTNDGDVPGVGLPNTSTSAGAVEGTVARSLAEAGATRSGD